MDDFQDLVVWRELPVETARLVRGSYESTLVMRMTVWKRDYFEELASGLRRVDDDLRCFRLTAAEDVLRGRIVGRDPVDGPHEWCLAHMPQALEVMRDDTFGEGVATDGRSPVDVAEAIVTALADKRNL